MVAEANKSRAAPIYAARSFRSREAVGALVALARKALVIVVLADEGAGTAAGVLGGDIDGDGRC